MAHTIRLSFGPSAALDITRNVKRQLTAVQTYCDGRKEGFDLSCNPVTEQGELKRSTSYTQITVEQYENGLLRTRNPDAKHSHQVIQQSTSYQEWVSDVQNRATEWTLAAGTSHAYDALARGEYQLAAETYRDILDHFPPPPSAPLLQWLYNICIAKTESLDAALDGLIRWYPEALDQANTNVISSVLAPAHDLLGADITKQLTETWLMHAQPQATATRLTKRWLSRLEKGMLGQSSWSSAPHNPMHLRGSKYACTPNGKVIVAGGVDAAGQLSSEVWCWEIGADQWTRFTPLPAGRCDHAMVTLWDNSIVVIGGQVENQEGSSTRFSRAVLSYNPEQDLWEPLPDLTIGRERCSAHVLRGRIVIAGGESPFESASHLEVWDRRKHQWLEGPELSTRAKKPQLCEQRGRLLLSGADISNSGTGLLVADLKDNSLSPANGLDGVPLNGSYPLSSGDLMVWVQKDNTLNIGVWSLERGHLRWTCTDVELPGNATPVRILPCDQDQFVMLYTMGTASLGARIITPERGLIDEIAPISESKFLDSVVLSDGRVLIIGQKSSHLLT